MAFAIYRAPEDFSRRSVDDSNLPTRTIYIRATPLSPAGTPRDNPVELLRPPVILIHGIWDDKSMWDKFTPLIKDTRFSVSKVDYSGPITVVKSTPSYSTGQFDIGGTGKSSLGFAFNAVTAGGVLDQIKGYITDFKHNTTRIPVEVAVTQADLIAHSMGGDIARTLPRFTGGFLTNDTFKKGFVHKLITLDTPHLGTPVATKLLPDQISQKDENQCVRNNILATWLGGYKYSFIDADIKIGSTSILLGDTRIPLHVSGAVGDLQGNGIGGGLSSALQAIKNQTFKIRTAMIGAKIGDNQLSPLDDFFSNATYIRRRCKGSPLADNLTRNLWPTVFATDSNLRPDSDAIVPLTSQFNGLTGVQLPKEAIHSNGTKSLGFGDPSVQEEVSTAPNEVIKFLNMSVSSSSFVLLPQ
jgi:pimeloyl-ACP methyl ester carboxylesterase